MLLNLTIDGVERTINTNPDKPLERILMEIIPSFPLNNSCLDSSCGNCVVLVNGSCVLSCLVPAYTLENATVTTFGEFKKTKECRNLERIYAQTGYRPCQQCYASKTMLINSVLQKAATGKRLPSRDYIAKEIGINSCGCMDSDQLYKIVHKAWATRSRKNG